MPLVPENEVRSSKEPRIAMPLEGDFSAIGRSVTELYRRTSSFQRLHGHLGSGWPFLKRGTLGHALTQLHGFHSSQPFYGNRGEAPWHVTKPGLQPWSFIRESFLAGVVQALRDQAKDELHVSSSVGQIDWSHEQGHRTIPQVLRAPSPFFIGQIYHLGRVVVQYLCPCGNWAHFVQNNLWWETFEHPRLPCQHL